MSKKNKMIERVLSIPSDLTWEELIKFLGLFGYDEINTGKTGGSRRKFANDKKEVISNLHEPHPGNIVKEYAIKDAIAYLKERDILKMNDILEYKGYYGSIHYSSKDTILYGKLVGINDLVSYEGESAAELKNAFQEAVEDYLETCKELNKEPDKMYKGSFNIRISSDLHRKAAMVAAIKNVTLNDLVRTAIDNLVKNSDRELVH